MPTDFPPPMLQPDEVDRMIANAIMRPDHINKGCIAMIASCMLVVIVGIVALFGHHVL
ncbi:MAG TPA: hypothetical protein VIG47_03095 [Gemmatimonadaceae bacterium]|jgi:hypothetical protein